MNYADKNNLYLEAIQSYCAFDNDFSQVVFKDKKCLEELLEVILGRKVNLTLLDTEHVIKNLHGRDIRVDTFSITDEGEYINVEIQVNNGGANPKRARYHGSLIDSDISFSNEKWAEIAPMIVIFITKNDVLGLGKPIYHIRNIIDETGTVFEDEVEIIYVNGRNQDETSLGQLMRDYHCTNHRDIHHKHLRERVKYLKESEGGRQEVSDALKKIIELETKEVKFETTLAVIRKLISKKDMSVEEAIEFVEVPKEERLLYYQQIYA